MQCIYWKSHSYRDCWKDLRREFVLKGTLTQKIIYIQIFAYFSHVWCLDTWLKIFLHLNSNLLQNSNLKWFFLCKVYNQNSYNGKPFQRQFLSQIQISKQRSFGSVNQGPEHDKWARNQRLKISYHWSFNVLHDKNIKVGRFQIY